MLKSPIITKEKLIRQRIVKTGRLGRQPLWEGYGEPDAQRSPSMVASHTNTGRFFSQLVLVTRPRVVVEFGAAFGVSGMYWLAGLEQNGRGHLYSYEINQQWGEVARQNLEAIGSSFTLTFGLFEDNIESTLGRKRIDIALIDGVHASQWVLPQFELVAQRLRRNGIVVLDDITFSRDMEQCWDTLSQDKRIKNAAILNGRVGILQLR